MLLAILAGYGSSVNASPDNKFTPSLRGGNYQDAFAAADAELKAGSTDASVRFFRAVALAQLGQTEAAIKEFSALARELPGAPEPHNNLAVLYAQQGDYDKAQAALEAALATNPSYRTAHKNLGDLYATMAAQAYNRALARDAQTVVNAPRLALLDSLENPEPRRLQPPPAAQAPPAKSAETSKPAAATPAPKPSQKPASPVAGKPAEKITPPAAAAAARSEPVTTKETEKRPAASAPAKAAAPAQAKLPATKAPAKPTTVAAAPASTTAAAAAPEKSGRGASWQAQALALNESVRAWARAWSAQDVAAYLAAYSASYVPEGGVSRADWEKARRQRIGAPKSIHVQVVDLQVKLHDEDTAAVRFMQHYKSELLEDTVEKRLDLTREHGQWKITREVVAKRNY